MAAASGLIVRLRVAYILDGFATPSAGTEQQFLALVRGIDRTRIEPRIFLLRGPDRLSELLPEIPVEVIGIDSLARPAALAKAIGLCLGLKKAGVGVAHLYFNDTAVLLPLPLRMCGIRVVVARRDLGFWYTRPILAALRIQRRFVDRVIANSHAVAQRVRDAEKFRAADVVVIPNGKEIPNETLPKAAARTAMRLPLDVPVLVVVANVKPLKRHADIVRALPAIRSRHPGALLVLAGADTRGVAGPSHLEEIRTLARSLTVEPMVIALGEIADPSTLIRAADVCLLCSETEGLSNAIIEYMLAGKPVVCTNVGGNPELIGEAGGGKLVGVGDAGQIAAAVNEYLADEALRTADGSRGRAFAVLRFGMSAMLKAHEALYASLVGTSRAARKENYVT